MPSRIDEAGHTFAFDYPVAEHWGESQRTKWSLVGFEPTSAHTYESEIQRSTTYATPTPPEMVKARTAKRRKETLKVIEGTDGVLSLRTADSAQVYLSMAEWGVANVRLMADLLAQGCLQRRDVEYYLAYTTYIYDLASQYEWQRYREIQAEYDHVWGQRAPHLEAELLMPRRQVHQVVSKQDNRKRNGNVGGYNARSMTSEMTTICAEFSQTPGNAPMETGANFGMGMPLRGNRSRWPRCGTAPPAGGLGEATTEGR